VAGINMARLLAGEAPTLPPPTTMLGALYRYLRESDATNFQPMNANFGLMDDLPQAPRDKRLRREQTAQRALAHLDAWREEHVLATPVSA
jgi:methylenetetrahydrofolate--tRNA-(uracil-5-)-methyltransferase